MMKRKMNRWLAGLLTVVMVLANVGANVTAAWADELDLGIHTDLAEAGAQEDEYDCRIALNQNRETGEYETYEIDLKEGLPAKDGWSAELPGVWSGDSDDVLQVNEDGSAEVLSPGEVTVTFTYVTTETEAEPGTTGEPESSETGGGVPEQTEAETAAAPEETVTEPAAEATMTKADTETEEMGLATPNDMDKGSETTGSEPTEPVTTGSEPTEPVTTEGTTEADRQVWTWSVEVYLEGGKVIAIGYAAVIGEVSYLTLQAAIDAAAKAADEAGRTITLSQDITENVEFPDGEYILNLNGFTISGAKNAASVITIGNGRVKLTINGGTDTDDSTMGTITGGAGTNGGGISVNQANSSLDSAQVSLNHVFISGNYVETSGGGIYFKSLNKESKLELNCVKIDGNEAQKGGGLYFDDQKGTLIITQSEVTNNTVTGSGGGIYIYNGTVEIEETDIKANSSLGDFRGGGMYCEKGSVSMKKVNLADNQATRGAGLYANEGTFSIKESEIKTNTIPAAGVAPTQMGSGAAVYANTRNISFEKTVFDGNISKKGGAIAYFGMGAEFTDCNIVSNEITGSASNGIIHAAKGTLVFKNSLLSGNTGAHKGAVYMAGSGTVTLTDTIVKDNSTSSATYSGGITICGSNSVVEIKGGAIYNNICGSSTPTPNDLYLKNGMKSVSVLPADEMSDPENTEYLFDQKAWKNKAQTYFIEGINTSPSETTCYFVTDLILPNIARNVLSGQEYKTIAEAAQSAGENGKIELIPAGTGKMVNLTQTEELSQNVTLDMKESKLIAPTNTKDILKITSGTVTIDNKDCKKPKTTPTATIYGNILLEGSGSLVLNSGTNVNHNTQTYGVGSILHNGENLTIGGYHSGLYVSLGKDKYITAGSTEDITGSYTITLSEEAVAEMTAFQPDESNPYYEVTIIAHLTAEQANKLLTTSSSLRVTNVPTGYELRASVARDHTISIVAAIGEKEEVNGIYLNGATGNDQNDGLGYDSAVKTLQKAKEILQDPKNSNLHLKEIYITGTLDVTNNDEWDLSNVNAKIVRYDGRQETEADDENSGEGNAFTGPVIHVKNGASLTLKNIQFDGMGAGDGTVKSGVYSKSALIVVDDGASLTLGEGTSLSNNYNVFGSYGGAIQNEGTLTMEEGSQITNNRAFYGAGVYNTGTFNMKGGTISGNIAPSSYKYAKEETGISSIYDEETGRERLSSGSAGGGVFVGERRGVMNFSGGLISENVAYNGGGIALGCLDNTAFSGSKLYMTGGTIDSNKAYNDGGGIYAQAGYRYPNSQTERENFRAGCEIHITEGRVTNNLAEGLEYENDSRQRRKVGGYGGGGIYVNGQAFHDNAKLYLENVAIGDNKFSGDVSGTGAIACCPSSNFKFYLTNGAVIYDNGGRRDVFVNSAMLLQGGHSGYPDVSVSAYMLGGGAYNWVDGKGKLVEVNQYGNIEVGKGENKDLEFLELSTDASAGNKDVQAAKSLVKVWITGNSSYMGGAGIGSNGDVQIGTADPVLRLEKVLAGNDIEARKQDTYALTITLSDSNGNAWANRSVTMLRNKRGGVIEGPTEESTDEKGQIKLSIEGGEIILLQGIPEGTKYTVEETTKQKETKIEVSWTKDGPAMTTEGKTTAVGSILSAGYTTAVTFTNIYEKVSVPVKVVKRMSDDSEVRLADDTFKFGVKLLNTTPDGLKEFVEYPQTIEIKLPKDVLSAENSQDDTITFEKAGTYYFEISEVQDKKEGYTYSKDVWHLTVTVKETNEGLEAEEVKYEKVGSSESPLEAATFVNQYQPASTNMTVNVTKYVTVAEGKKVPTGIAEFTFNMSLASGPEDGVSFTNTVKAVIDYSGGRQTGTAEFENIWFTKAGTYVFTISEATGAGSRLPGYVYDTGTWKVTVVVTDVGGKLEVSAETYERGDGKQEAHEGFWFENDYDEALVVYAPKVSKRISGPVPEGEKETFTFTLEPQSNYGTAVTFSEAENAKEVSVDGVGTASFADIKFNEAGTYVFTIEEIDTAYPGYTNDRTPWTLTVTVEDGENLLQITGISYNRTVDGSEETSGEEATFTNLYDTKSGEYAPAVKKVIEGDTPATAAEFVFEMAAVSGPEDGAVLPDDKTATVTGATSGNFGLIQFTKAGTYEFRITETEGRAAGYTYDKAVWTLTVVVEDRNSQLTVVSSSYSKDGEESDANDDAAVFTNQYEVKPDEYIPAVEKQIEGDTPATDAEFTFEIAAVANPENGAVLPENTKATVTGAASGNFGAIQFTKAGTYEFRITETKGEDADYTYDKAVWTLTVVVEDRDGQLTVVSASYSKDGEASDASRTAATFTNTYTSRPGSLSIEKTVTGEGADKTKEFTFRVTLKDENGADLSGSYPYEGSAVEGVTVPESGSVTGGSWEFHLRHGQKVTISGIPAGSQYTVTEQEANQDGYTTAVNGSESGQIVSDQTAAVEYVNNKPVDSTGPQESSSSSTETTEPPTNPTEPSTSPTEPTEPSTNPSESSPENPTNPSEPSPENPTNPSEPSPENPTNPNEPSPENPTEPSPENPTEPVVEIEEEEVPLADFPPVEIVDEAVPLTSTPSVEIFDEDVPLAATVPKTGDEAHAGLAGMLALVALGMMGMFGALSARRKDDAE